VEWLVLRDYEVDVDECNCPECGRPLCECLSPPGVSRYCWDCDREFRVKVKKVEDGKD
jgi:hypothetical protein